MIRIVNDFILELPELIVRTDLISDDWIEQNKPLKRFAILDKKPEDPVLSNFIGRLNKDLFDERITYMLIKFNSFEEYAAHVDASRNTGLNLVIRGDKSKSPIKYYDDNDLVNPIFEYQYQNYPILMTSKKYHSIRNESESERILFTIHLKQCYTFESLRDKFIFDDPSIFFSKV